MLSKRFLVGRGRERCCLHSLLGRMQLRPVRERRTPVRSRVYEGRGERRDQPGRGEGHRNPTQGDTTHTYTAETANDGSYSLDLPAGTYELTGTLTTRIPGGLTTPEEVTIAPGETTTMDLFAIYP